jgi:hypothetical protein
MQGILKNKMLTQAGIPLYKMPCFLFLLFLRYLASIMEKQEKTFLAGYT